MSEDKKFSYVDLFSGAGGMSLGFNEAGFKNVFSVEFNEKIAKTYEMNFPDHKLFVGDIKQLNNNDIDEMLQGRSVDVIVGGPPCQGFSMAGNPGRTFIDDPRNELFKEFVRVVSNIRPSIFVMENVARLATHNGGKTMEEILNSFQDLGYEVQYKVLQAADYSIPQKRQRVFIVGTIPGIEFHYPEPSGKVISVKDAIDDLPKLENGEVSEVPNHFAMKHSDQMLKKMSFISDGGSRDEIPESIRPKSGDARKYIKYDSKLPAYTVTGDNRKIFHYNQNRALSPRELARIQTFPDDFVFYGTSGSIQQQIGNAVPPLLAKQIAEQVKKALKGKK